MLNKFFKLFEHGTSVKTEVIAGITTFLTMAYILFVNSGIVAETGLPFTGIFLATAYGHKWKFISKEEYNEYSK